MGKSLQDGITADTIRRMGTLAVHKFGISLDPQELVDFSEKIEFFTDALTDLGFVQSGTYTFRYSDDECMMKAELQRSPDGYFLWMYVQAVDEHQYRVREIAEAFGGYVVVGAKKPA
jgi:hypothetical protein